MSYNELVVTDIVIYLLTFWPSPFSANSALISLCFFVEKNMYELLNRLGACGAFLYFTGANCLRRDVDLLVLIFFMRMKSSTAWRYCWTQKCSTATPLWTITILIYQGTKSLKGRYSNRLNVLRAFNVFVICCGYTRRDLEMIGIPVQQVRHGLEYDFRRIRHDFEQLYRRSTII